jgi:hypothetical protein
MQQLTKEEILEQLRALPARERLEIVERVVHAHPPRHFEFVRTAGFELQIDNWRLPERPAPP